MPLSGKAAVPTAGAMLTDVALLLAHVRVLVLPAVMVVGFATRVTVGAAGGAATFTVNEEVAVPPAPVAVIL